MEQGQQHQHCCPDYAFAFDDAAFSDRILKLLIFDDSSEESRDNRSTGECAVNHLFRSLKQMKEEIPESHKEITVKNLHINSLVLAAKSPFFHKLFTNDMKASNQHEVTIRLHSSEEAAFLCVIKFIYNSELLTTDSPNALLGVLFAADKFSVPSCAKKCCNLLLSFSMTPERALCYVDLPSIISPDYIQPLLNQAKNFLPNILKDIWKYREHIINLSLEGIKIILSRDDLKVDSEDDAYDLLIEWTQKHFPDSGERGSILIAEMFDLIRFQNMTPQKMKRVLRIVFNTSNLDQNAVNSMTEAIFSAENKSSLPTRSRAYNVLPVAAVTFNAPVKQCVVFLDLKREECKDISMVMSQTFTLDGNVFSLTVLPQKDEIRGYTFGLFLYLKTRKNKIDVDVQFEFAARQKSSPREFVKWRETYNATFKLGETFAYGYHDLFNATWEAVMDKNSHFLINGTLHLRVDLILSTEKEK